MICNNSETYNSRISHTISPGNYPWEIWYITPHRGRHQGIGLLLSTSVPRTFFIKMNRSVCFRHHAASAVFIKGFYQQVEHQSDSQSIYVVIQTPATWRWTFRETLGVGGGHSGWCWCGPPVGTILLPSAASWRCATLRPPCGPWPRTCRI